MRLPRSGRRPRKTASAASPPAAINNAPPMASALSRAGPEFSGDDAAGFVDAIEPGGGTEPNSGGVTGGELVGANKPADGAGTALV